MIAYLRSLFRVTAVRLSIVYTLIFGIVAIGIVIYISKATVDVLREQYQTSIEREVTGIENIYRKRGLRGLIKTLERRSRAPGANLYVVIDTNGQILAGNVERLQPGVSREIGWTRRPFRYDRYGDERGENHHAIARIIELPSGLRVLVGRDLQEHDSFKNAVTRGLFLALGSMLALGLLTWFFVGRRALKRIDSVSRSSVRIMGGDREERLPISGSGDEFDRLSENLNHMLDRIHQLNEGVKQVSDNIAHDLKTPITRLRNKAEETLALRGDPQARDEAIGEIITDCDQIVRTFDALLKISRVESGSSIGKMEKVDLVPLMADLHELYEAVAEEEEIGFTYQAPDQTTLCVRGNRELLSQAVSNLIDNAIKYGAIDNDDPRVDLSVAVEEGYAVITCADNGMGISEAERERAKQRFVRLDQSRNRPGNGLGLSLVEAVAHMHDGTLGLHDNHCGLKVQIVLPMGDEAK